MGIAWKINGAKNRVSHFACDNEINEASNNYHQLLNTDIVPSLYLYIN